MTNIRRSRSSANLAKRDYAFRIAEVESFAASDMDRIEIPVGTGNLASLRSTYDAAIRRSGHGLCCTHVADGRLYLARRY